MMRVVLLSGLAALILNGATATAQEAGGVRLTPEILNTENVQGRVVDHVFGRLQQVQQLRALSALAGPTTGAKAEHPSVDRQAVSQEMIGRNRGDAGFLAGFARGKALAASRTPQPQVADTPQSLIVNAYDSPVSIGNNNIVQQQVTSSTAIGGTATAVAPANGAVDQQGRGQGKSQAGGAFTTQSAVSNAVSVDGGVAHSVAVNNNVVSQGNR
jgi:hypothetical protein